MMSTSHSIVGLALAFQILSDKCANRVSCPKGMGFADVDCNATSSNNTR